jgi:hypothetical protein
MSLADRARFDAGRLVRDAERLPQLRLDRIAAAEVLDGPFDLAAGQTLEVFLARVRAGT